MKRGCTYEDVCNVIVFLASDQASYMTARPSMSRRAGNALEQPLAGSEPAGRLWEGAP